MFDSPCQFEYLGTRATLVPDPVRKYNYRFVAQHRRYLVTFELYSFNAIAVKYCDMDDRNASNRYDKIFNDDDAFKVIGTCLHIMLNFWRKNPGVTFCFYAVPRKWDETLLEGKELQQNEKRRYAERYKKVRFEIYNYAMVNLFPPTSFTHLRDKRNAIYVLLNKRQPKPKTTIKKLGRFLLNNYSMIFEPGEN